MKTLIILSSFFLWSIGTKAAELAFPAQTEKVSIVSEGYKLFGTMNVPEAKEKLSVLLLVAGSGPTDRDGNQPTLSNNSFKMLAHELAAYDIATLRYDKRGIAESSVPGFSNADVIFENYITDAENWIKYLKKDERFSKVLVAGLSEGSLIGMVAAKRQKADGYISLNGAGKAADQIIVDQLNANGTPMNIMAEVHQIIKKINEGEIVNEVPAYLLSLFNVDTQPYLRSWFAYDPRKELAKLNIPVLLVQGTHDIQVAIENAKALKEAKPDAELILIEGMNHILKDAPADRMQNFATYNQPDLKLNDELIESLTQFIP